MKNILIFGATSSIAVATSIEFAKENANFFLVARNKDKLSIVIEKLFNAGAGKIEHYIADLAFYENNNQLLKLAIASFCNYDLVLIAHATKEPLNADELPIEKLKYFFDVNLFSPISLLQNIISKEFLSKFKHIAVFCSIAGERGIARNIMYLVCKGGLSLYLESLRCKLNSEKIIFHNIKPGPTLTPLTINEKKSIYTSNSIKVGRCVANGINKNKEIIYAPLRWKFIMFILRNIPTKIFKKMKL